MVASFVIALAMLTAAGPADARPKKPVKMNSCSCACRQDDGGDTVSIANKDFYSVASCGSYSGTQCNVSVSTSDGTRTVAGTWEGCIDHGKVWVLIRGTLADDLPTLVADPGDVLKPPKRPRGDAVRPDTPPLTRDPGVTDPPPPADEPRTDAAADRPLERSPD